VFVRLLVVETVTLLMVRMWLVCVVGQLRAVLVVEWLWLVHVVGRVRLVRVEGQLWLMFVTELERMHVLELGLKMG
jgi:hypothetical protein